MFFLLWMHFPWWFQIWSWNSEISTFFTNLVKFVCLSSALACRVEGLSVKNWDTFTTFFFSQRKGNSHQMWSNQLSILRLYSCRHPVLTFPVQIAPPYNISRGFYWHLVVMMLFGGSFQAIFFLARSSIRDAASCVFFKRWRVFVSLNCLMTFHSLFSSHFLFVLWSLMMATERGDYVYYHNPNSISDLVKVERY